jgi:hypothetical protein
MADLDQCRGCAHYRNAAVFELCQHPKSAYEVAGRSDFHTITHMREYRGLCGEDASLLKRKEEKR